MYAFIRIITIATTQLRLGTANDSNVYLVGQSCLLGRKKRLQHSILAWLLTDAKFSPLNLDTMMFVY